MSVVSNTSPLNYLILIEHQDILPRLFGHVLIPNAVRGELSSPAAPVAVRKWISQPPSWLEIRRLGSVPTDLSHLGSGEQETIALAQAEAAAVLLDERLARQVADGLGLEVVGTLAVLDGAARREWLDLNDALDRLQRTTFRASPRLLSHLRSRSRSRP